MQIHNKDNIIRFENKFQSTSNAQESLKNKQHSEKNQVITLSKKTLYKNAALVDILKDDFEVVDILIEKDKIKRIAKPREIRPSPEIEIYDLKKNFVLPSFWNYFCRPDKLLGAIAPKTNEKVFEELFFEASRMANFLAGNTVMFNLQRKNSCFLENILDCDEKELENLSNEIAKKNKTVFLHMGLTLDELGSVEKKFGKPLVQVLEDFGFLDRNWVLVGGNCLEKDDFQILSQYEGVVVLCPLEDACVGRRTLNIQMLKNLGIDIALGSGQSIDVDMFEAIKHLLATQRALFEDANALSEKDALLMATCGQSTLKEGDQAHFIVMRNEPSLRESLVSYLVWEASKYGLLLTVADGNALQFDGYIYNNELDMNYFDVLEKLNEMKEKTKK